MRIPQRWAMVVAGGGDIHRLIDYAPDVDNDTHHVFVYCAVRHHCGRLCTLYRYFRPTNPCSGHDCIIILKRSVAYLVYSSINSIGTFDECSLRRAWSLLILALLFTHTDAFYSALHYTTLHKYVITTLPNGFHGRHIEGWI